VSSTLTKRLVTLLGVVLVLASLYYLFRTSARSLAEAGGLSRLVSFDPLLFLASCALLQLHLVGAAWSWKRVAGVSGHRISLRDAYKVHFVALVGKYLPGKVWAAVGKIGLSRRIGMPASSASQALVLETLFIVLGTLCTSLPLVPGLSGKLGIDLFLCFALLIALISLLLATGHPSAHRWIFRLAGRLTGRDFTCADPGFGRVLRLLPVYVLVLLMLGASFLLLARSFGLVIPVLPGISLFPASVGVGFLVLLAPAGLGVSEVTLTWLTAIMLQPGVDPGRLALVALASRIWISLNELLAFSIAVGFWGGRKALSSLLPSRNEAGGVS
jgi:hypothetical protein